VSFPACRASVRVPSARLGKRTVCPRCDEPFTAADPAARSGNGLLILTILGGLFLFVGGVIAIVVILVVQAPRARDKGAEAVAAGGKKTEAVPEPAPKPPPPVPTVPPQTPAPTPTPAPTSQSPPPMPVTDSSTHDIPAAGGAFSNLPYRDVQPDGTILVGFEVGLGKVFNTDIISYLRPIWRTAAGKERLGTAYGKAVKGMTTVKARDGYAIGGVVVRGGGALEGICFTFMRVGPGGLSPADSYVSDWFGEQSRRPPPSQMRAGDGSPVVGIHGKRFEDKGGVNYNDGGAIGTIGLVLAGPKP
jgi:hypothetical protein